MQLIVIKKLILSNMIFMVMVIPEKIMNITSIVMENKKKEKKCFEQNENKEEIEKKEQILVVKIINEKNHENSS